MCASAHPPSLSWDAPYKTAHTARRTGIKEKISLRGSERFFFSRIQQLSFYPSGLHDGGELRESNIGEADPAAQHSLFIRPGSKNKYRERGKSRAGICKNAREGEKKRDWRVSRDSARIKPLFSLCAVCVCI